MEPRFKCPFCGKERSYEASPRAATITGSIFLESVYEHLYFTSTTFCNVGCLTAYIESEEMDKLEARYD